MNIFSVSPDILGTVSNTGKNNYDISLGKAMTNKDEPFSQVNFDKFLNFKEIFISNDSKLSPTKLGFNEIRTGRIGYMTPGSSRQSHNSSRNSFSSSSTDNKKINREKNDTKDDKFVLHGVINDKSGMDLPKELTKDKFDDDKICTITTKF